MQRREAQHNCQKAGVKGLIAKAENIRQEARVKGLIATQQRNLSPGVECWAELSSDVTRKSLRPDSDVTATQLNSVQKNCFINTCRHILNITVMRFLPSSWRVFTCNMYERSIIEI